MSSPSKGQEGYRIAEVSFTGNQVFDEDYLSDKLLYPAVGWFARTFSGEDPHFFSEQALTEEMESLVRFYQQEGFLDASVKGTVTSWDDGGQTVELTYAISEAESVLVGSVDIVLNSPVGDSVAALVGQSIGRRSGLRFRDAQVEQDRAGILRILNNHGFPYSTANDTITLSSMEDSANVLWRISPGPLAYFGNYSIQGAELYDEELITDRLHFSEGDIYRQSSLEQTQGDIYDLALYRVVSIKALLTEHKEAQIPVAISLKESSRYRFQMGVGYGRDEKFRVSGRIDILGILGTAGQLSFEVKRSALEPLTLFVTYTHPDFLLPKARFSVRPFLRREDEPGYEARRRGYEIGLTKPLWTNFYASVGYNHESVELLRYPDVPLPGNFRTDYPKESAVLTVGYASARPLFSPSSGITAALSTTYSGLNLISSDEYEYSRLLLDFRFYTLLQPWMVMATRLKVGSIRSRDAEGFVPFEERFYAGGSVSVRGWARSELGPLDPSGKPTGGSSLLETGVELRFPQGSAFQGVTFLDIGDVWETPLTYKLNELGYAAGAGVRYETPIGPLRLDIAHPLFIGSEEVQWWFSIGHAF